MDGLAQQLQRVQRQHLAEGSPRASLSLSDYIHMNVLDNSYDCMHL
jgi:hypothetical protein